MASPDLGLEIASISSSVKCRWIHVLILRQSIEHFSSLRPLQNGEVLFGLPKIRSALIALDWLVRSGHVTLREEADLPEIVELLHLPLHSLFQRLTKKALSARRLEVHVQKCPRYFEFREKPYFRVRPLLDDEEDLQPVQDKVKEGLIYRLCAELPSETKVVYTSGLFGLSSEQLDAIEVGLKKLTALV